jgi:hypothetical protein
MGEEPEKENAKAKETLTDKVVRVVSAFKPINIEVKVEPKEVIIGGRKITTEKYLEQNGEMSFTTRPELPPSKKDETNSDSELDNELFDESDGFVNVDLLQEEAITTKQFFSKAEVMRTYNHVLSKKDLAAVLDAYRVCSKEDSGQKDASQAKDNLVKSYDARGRTIYNFVRSRLFETEIKERLEVIKRENNDPLLAVISFSKYFDSLIEFHPTKIYVALGWDVNDLLSEVSKRYQILKQGDDKEIWIYSRSSNRNTVDKLKEVESIKQAFNCKDENYNFGKEPAKTTKLTLK